MDIGIDLGTTFSVLAVNGKVDLVSDYPPGIYLKDCDVTIIPSPLGESKFPSVVWKNPAHSDRYLFGSDALQMAEEGQAPVMFSKRKMGTREAISIGDQIVVAKDVAKVFLWYLRKCAEQAIGHSVTRAVITHPAYFDRSAVEETREAAQQAGFDMSLQDQLVMEPVAAALAYIRTDRRDPLRLLTFDLGGGTFDVSYLERTSGIIDMRSFDGDPLLGGYNFDRLLLHWVCKRLQAQGRKFILDEENLEDRGRLARLLMIAEQVKIALANARTDSKMVEFRARDILVDIDGRPIQINERISRKQFVKLIESHLDKTIACCERTLKKADVEVGDVDEVLFVGGSTYGPWIAERVSAWLPQVTVKPFHPDLCVGAGAAIHAKMVLPVRFDNEKYKLSIDVPKTSAIDIINITGQVIGLGENPLVGVAVCLILPDNNLLGPKSLSSLGRFFFEDIELLDSKPSIFTVKVVDDKGAELVAHGFEIIYSPDNAETSNVTTVLPKPLFIETVDGFVALAEEGMTLPSRCEQTFQRENDKPNISLQLFQDQEPIGDIRIENIPAEGGRGSYVDLIVDITEKNQIKGTAEVRTPQGQIVAKCNVQVHLQIADVPTVAELRRQLDDLAARGTSNFKIEDKEVQNPEKLINSIENLFEQLPIERQEIQVGLRQLRYLLQPPEEDLKPTRQEFLGIVKLCNNAIEASIKKVQSISTGEGHENNYEHERQLMGTDIEVTRRKTRRFGKILKRLEHQGLTALKQNDKKSWSQVNESLQQLEHLVRERQTVDTQPTELQKKMVSSEVRRLKNQLHAKAEFLESDSHFEDWIDEINRLHAGLDSALRTIEDIDDALPSRQGRAKTLLIYTRILQPIEKAIARIGVDVSQVKANK